MSIYKVVIYPDAILRQTCQKVERFDDRLMQFLHAMTETMYAYRGIGLAANQVGSLHRLFVMDVPHNLTPEEAESDPEEEEIEDEENETAISERESDTVEMSEPAGSDGDEESADAEPMRNPLYIINPEIVRAEGQAIYTEGCLSIPDVRERVKRHAKLVLKYQNERGESCEREFINLEAVCVQHELDHLNGKIFFDRLSPVKRRMTEKKYLKSIKSA